MCNLLVDIRHERVNVNKELLTLSDVENLRFLETMKTIILNILILFNILENLKNKRYLRQTLHLKNLENLDFRISENYCFIIIVSLVMVLIFDEI